MHLAVAPILFLLIAAEIAVFGTCTVCDVVEVVNPISFDPDDYDEDTICPGEELRRVPGTTQCVLVMDPDDVVVW